MRKAQTRNLEIRCAIPRNDSCVGCQRKNKIIFCLATMAVRPAVPISSLNNNGFGSGAMAKRQLKLGAFMRPVSIHTGAWRYPGAWPDANFNFAHIKQLIQKLEAGKFDAFFMADHLAVLNMPISALKRSHTVTSFEPFTLLSALSAVTEYI
jgi:alkanesulfonate monooxygenase